jgi:hypothetical protein
VGLHLRLLRGIRLLALWLVEGGELRLRLEEVVLAAVRALPEDVDGVECFFSRHHVLKIQQKRQGSCSCRDAMHDSAREIPHPSLEHFKHLQPSDHAREIMLRMIPINRG